MNDDFEIRMLRKGIGRAPGTSCTLVVPCASWISGNQVDVAMEICNRHFGDPTRNIGGPQLPAQEKR